MWPQTKFIHRKYNLQDNRSLGLKGEGQGKRSGLSKSKTHDNHIRQPIRSLQY